MNKKLPNTILIELPGCLTISGINIYNYTKNIQRGVREMEIFMDYSCIYRVNHILYRVTSEEQTSMKYRRNLKHKPIRVLVSLKTHKSFKRSDLWDITKIAWNSRLSLLMKIKLCHLDSYLIHK